MTSLEDAEFVLLGGPLAGTRNVLLIIRAADRAEVELGLAADPWSLSGVLTVTATRPWQIRLDSTGLENG